MLSHLLGAQAAPSKRNLKLLRHLAGIAWPGDHHIEVRFHQSLCCQEIRLGISTRSVEDDQNSPCHTRDRWADGKSWMRSKLNMAAGQGSKNGSVRSGAPWKTTSQMCLQVNPAEIKQVPGHAMQLNIGTKKLPLPKCRFSQVASFLQLSLPPFAAIRTELLSHPTSPPSRHQLTRMTGTWMQCPPPWPSYVRLKMNTKMRSKKSAWARSNSLAKMFKLVV